MQSNQLVKEVRWLLEEKYQGVMTEQASRDIRRLQKGQHIDYVIGFVTFLGCKIDLSSRPFIPEPETEYWAQKAIEAMKNSSREEIKCLDIFAGSGCVGIALLAHLPRVTIDFADIHERYLTQVKANAKLNHINSSRYRLVCSDVFSCISGKYDYILANPPYIATTKQDKVQPSVLLHEPHDALFGGVDGLGIIRRFLGEAKDHVRLGGRIYMECDSWQKAGIEEILNAYEYRRYEFYKDQFGLTRFLVIDC